MRLNNQPTGPPMIDPNLNIRPTVLAIPEERVAFRVDAKNMSLIMDILSNKLYSDKPLAVIREYVCNAWDACKAAGNSDRAIVIHCPTHDEPYFSVRDFGYGLTTEEISQVFVSYGESTKRHSNDFTGMLGIGSKAGFAYTDGFNIVNRDGTNKTTYTAQKTSDGGATLAKVGQTPCGEDAGLEIVVYVENHDISTFHEKLAKFLRFATDKYETNIPVPYTERVFPNPEDQTYFRIKDYRCDAGVLMGNIRYAFNVGQLPSLQYEERCFAANTTFIVPMGSVSFTPSRESIEYTPKTVEFLTKTVREIRARAKAYIDAQIAKVDNVVDALELSDLATDFSFKIGNFKVGEHTINDLQNYLRACSTASIMKNGKLSRSTKGRYSYVFNKNDVFVRVDEHPDMKKRVCARAWTVKGSDRVFLIAESNDVIGNKIKISDLNLKTVLLSSIPVPKIVRVASESAPRKSGYVRGLYELDGTPVSWEDLEEIEDEEKFLVAYDLRRNINEDLLKEAGYDIEMVFSATQNFIERKVEGFTILDYAAAETLVMAKYAHLSDAIAFSRSCSDSDIFEKICGVNTSTVDAVPDYIRATAKNSEQSNAWIKKYNLIKDLRRFGNETLGRNWYDVRMDFVDAMLPHIEAFKASVKP